MTTCIEDGRDSQVGKNAGYLLVRKVVGSNPDWVKPMILQSWNSLLHTLACGNKGKDWFAQYQDNVIGPVWAVPAVACFPMDEWTRQ